MSAKRKAAASTAAGMDDAPDAKRRKVPAVSRIVSVSLPRRCALEMGRDEVYGGLKEVLQLPALEYLMNEPQPH